MDNNQPLNNAIIIQIPHESYILSEANKPESNNYANLPMIETFSDSSIGIDPEYNDPVLEIEGGKKRKKINKKKQKKLKKNTLLGKSNANMLIRLVHQFAE